MRPAGVAPQVNLRNPLHTGEKACKSGIHSGFEAQGRCHQKSKTGVSVAPQRGFVSQKIFNKRYSCEKLKKRYNCVRLTIFGFRNHYQKQDERKL